MTLHDQPLVPARLGETRLRGEALTALTSQLQAGWLVVDEHQLQRDFAIPDWRAAVVFVNAVADLAEAVNHHPEITLSSGNVRVVLWTHDVDGLHAADVVMAARIELLA